MNITSQTIFTHLASGNLDGHSIVKVTKTVGDLEGYWDDSDALARLDSATPLYITQSWLPEGEETAGALAWGNTTLFPGRVGREYFMTRGHFHRKREKGELVICVSGTGALMLMDEQGETRIEPLAHGSTHYVSGHTAHRTINTGALPLVFLCAWAADCGHDYDEIRERGFSRLLVEVNGAPTLIARQQKR